MQHRDDLMRVQANERRNAGGPVIQPMAGGAIGNELRGGATRSVGTQRCPRDDAEAESRREPGPGVQKSMSIFSW